MERTTIKPFSNESNIVNLQSVGQKKKHSAEISLWKSLQQKKTANECTSHFPGIFNSPGSLNIIFEVHPDRYYR